MTLDDMLLHDFEFSWIDWKPYVSVVLDDLVLFSVNFEKVE